MGLLIVLHGWGANAQDLAALAPYLQLPEFQMVFPNAPFPHPYAPGGYMWYDLPDQYSFQSGFELSNSSQVLESRQRLTDWLTALADTIGVPICQTILGGFSQGGAMTLDVGSHLPLAGLMVLSGYLHAPWQPPSSPLPPMLMVHGRHDLVVPIMAARQAHETIIQLGAAVEYRELDMGHEIRPEILNFMQSFIGKVASSFRKTA